MIIELSMSSSIPIYIQIRNEIIKGIGKGELKNGDTLPTIRSLANDIGVNPMTVNKAYALLKQEGFIIADRRLGAKVCLNMDATPGYTLKLEQQLQLLSSEAILHGIEEKEFLIFCKNAYREMKYEEEDKVLDPVRI